jgi:hypothetical protein
MKLSLRIYRCATVPQHWIASLLGLPDETPAGKLDEELRAKFRPFPPRLKIWWCGKADELSIGEGGLPKFNHVVIGMEALSFDLTEQKIPCGGICMTDPMDPLDVDRMDGALESEIARWGMSVDFGFEWRAEYALTGGTHEV